MIKQYKIHPEGVKKLKRQTILIVVPILVLGTILGILAINQNSKGQVEIISVIIPVLFSSIVFFLLIRVNIKKQQETLKSYLLTIDDHSITQVQDNKPLVSIPLSEIQSIQKSTNGGIIITGFSKTHTIGIPAQIENKPELEEFLNTLVPVTENKKFLGRFQPVINIAWFVLLFTFFLAHNKTVILIAGSLLTAIAATYSVMLFRSPAVYGNTKKVQFIFVLVVLFFACMTYTKYTGSLPFGL